MNRSDMSTEQVSILPPREKTPRTLARFWSQSGLGVKLMVPAGILLALILLAFFTFILPTLNTYIDTTTRIGFNSQIDRLNEHILSFFQEGERTIGSMAESPIVRNLIDLRQSTDSIYMGFTERTLANLLIANMDNPTIPMNDLRILGPNGMQLVKFKVTKRQPPFGAVPVNQDTLVSESAADYYQAILALRPGEVYFSNPSLDEPLGGGNTAPDIEFQVGSPVYANDTLVGIVVASFHPRGFLEAAFQPSGFELFQFRTILYAQNGTPVLVAETGAKSPVAVWGDADFIVPNVPSNLLAGSNQPPTVIGDRTYRTQLYSDIADPTVAEVRNTGFRLVVSKPENAPSVTRANEVVSVTILQSLLLVVGIGVFVALIGLLVIRPLTRVNDVARRIGGGNLKARVKITSSDEIGQLGTVLNAMAERLGDLIDSLERRVSERTRNLKVVADISREAAQERNINLLLQQTVDAIRERFDFYHAQVFLLDDAGEYAVLVTSTGDAGRELLARNHRLEVGSLSIVGQVAAKRRTFITLDTQQSEVPHRFNPLLPLTRSEMALPLIATEKLIGVLDVQSVKSDAFGSDDVQTFQALADQLAIAIDNARLIAEQRQRAEQIDTLNRQLTRNAWEEYVQEEASNIGYTYDLMKTVPILPTGASIQLPKSEDSSLELPISIRGQMVGTLSIAELQDLPLSSDERAIVQAVVDRVSLAIENVRLVEQSQNALTRVEQLYEATRALSAAPDIPTIYRMITDRLESFPIVDRVAVLLASPTPTFDVSRFEYAYTWNRVAIDGVHELQSQGFLPRSAVPERWLSSLDRAPVIGDVETDLANLPMSKKAFESMGIKSLVIASMATRERWFGALLVQSQRPTAFASGFAQFVSAIADQVAIALENRFLIQESTLEAQRNRALAEAAQVATQVGADFESGVASLIRKVAPVAGYNHWWVGTIERAARGILIRKAAVEFMPTNGLNWLDTISLERDRNSIAEAVRASEPLLINNPAHHPALASLTADRANQLGKHITVPIRSGDTNVGALLVGRGADQGDMTERDLQLAQTLANQIAVILENQRLFNAAQRERETLQTIINSLPIAVTVVDAQNQETVLSNEQARTLLGLDALEPFEMVHTSSDAPYAPNELPALRVIETGESIFGEDMTIIDEDGRRTDVLVSAVPILENGQIVSAVAVYQDVTELRELENVLQESLRETTTLYEVSRALAAEHDLENILSVMAGQVYGLFVPDFLFTVFITQGGSYQVYRMEMLEEGAPAVKPAGSASPVPLGILKQDETYVDTDIAENPEYGNDPQIKAMGIASLCVLPLNARSQTIGWLVVGFANPRDFAPEERRTLRNMADQTAVAAESARLADQTARALTTTTTLYETSLNISRAESIEATLRVLSDQLLYLEPDEMDVFLINERYSTRRVEWIVHWDRSMEDSGPRIDLENPSNIEEGEFLEAEAIYLDDASAAQPDLLDRISGPLGWNSYSSYASIPMNLKGRVTGRICIGFHKPFRFGRSEQQTISTLADQSAIAIDNFLLVQQTQESLDETAVLYEASRIIGNSTDLKGDLSRIIDQVVQAIVKGALIVRLIGDNWDAPDAAVLIETSWRRDEEDIDLTGIRFSSDQFLIWPDLAAGEMIWASDLDDPDSASVTDPAAYELFRFRSVIVLPLKTSGRGIGALLLGSDVPWPYTEREARIYSSLADLVAISMERQRLDLQTNRRAQQLEISAQIAQSASSILNLQELFDRTVDLIKDSFGYDHAQIFLITPDGKDARVVASTGEAGRQLLAIGHHLGVGSRSIIGTVTSLGKPQIVTDITAPNSVHRPNPILPKTRAEMALPLQARNRILGALDVQSNEPGTFTPDDVAVLSSLADQIAIAIDNAELFENSNRRVEEMRFLFDATRTATQIAEQGDRALNEIAQMVRQNMAVAATSIMLLDDNNMHLLTYSATSDEDQLAIPSYYDFRTPFFETFAEDKESIIVNDVPALLKMAQATQQLGQVRLVRQLQTFLSSAGSVAIVPLVSGDNFIGLIAVTKNEPQGFDDDTLRLLQTLASSLAALAQNARLLRQVQSANVRLLELDKLKNQFLANMSHELRTPLNSIIGFSRVILKGIDGPLTEMQEQDLSTIYESGKHLLGLVNDILDQAKIEADRMEFSNESFSIVDLIKGVMSTAVGLVKDKPIRLHTEIENALPNVWGDEFRTRQALLNLVSNAAKFTPQGSITVAAFRTEDAGEPYVQVSVTDTGIGIPLEKLEAIFEPFQQAENSAARQYEGTGLGLPIARKLVVNQGGKLWCTSQPGIGSTFHLTMPINKRERRTEEETEQEAK